MTEVQYGIRLTASGADQVAREMNTVADAAERINQQGRSAAPVNTAWADSTNRQAAASHASSEAVRALDDDLKKLLSSIDPAYKAMSQLDAGHDLLTRGLKEGLITQTQYQSALGQMAGAFSVADKSALGAAFSTVQARRELVVLGHEAMSGNFSRIPGSFMVLAERANISGAAIAATLGPIAALAAGGIALGVAFVQGHQEMVAMNTALAVTSNYAGLTRGQMRELAQDISTAGTQTIGTSKQIVTALVSSGTIGAQAISQVAAAADNFAAAMGTDAAKVGPELVKLFADPARGAEELNQRLHFLSPAELEHIRALQQMGQATQAQLELATKLNEFLPKHQEQLGTLATAWGNVRKWASGAWDAMLGIGREATLEETLARAQANVARAAGGSLIRARSGAAAGANQGSIVAAYADVADAQEGARMSGNIAELNRRQNQGADAARAISPYQQLLELKRQIALIEQWETTNDDDRRVKADALRVEYEKLAKLQEPKPEKDAGQQLVGQLEDRLAQLQGQGSEVDKVIRQLTEGTKKYSDENIAAALAIAGEIDDMKAKVELDKSELDYLQKMGDQRAKDTGTVDDFTAKLRDHVATIEAETAGYQQNNTAKETAIALEKLKKEALEASAKVSDDDVARQVAIQNAYAAQAEILPGLIAAKNAAKDTAEQTKQQGQEWNRMWNSVENVGKQAFVHVLSDGKNAFQSIGQALKTSVIDVLYELTARKWIIDFGTNVASAFGIPTGALAAKGSTVGGIGSLGSNALGATGLYGSFATSSLGASLGLSTAGLMGPTASGAALSGMTALGTALPYVGAGLAIAGALGLFGGGKTSSVLQGFDVEGSMGAGGFTGNVTAFDQLGNKWAATGEEAYLRSLTMEYLTHNPNAGNLIGNQTTPISFQTGPDNTLLQAPLTNAATALLDAGKQLQDAAKTQQEAAETQAEAALQNIAQQLPQTLGITSLQQAQSGLATSDYQSPLDRFSAARQLLSSTYAKAMGGDLSAVNSFGGVLQSALSVGRDVYASGPQFQDLFVEGNRQLNSLLANQQNVQADILRDVDTSIQQAAADQIGEIKKQTTALVDQLAAIRVEIRKLAV